MSITKKFEIVAFYKFTKLSDAFISMLQKDLLSLMIDHNIFGTITLAPDGINSTIAGPLNSITVVLDRLSFEDCFLDIKAQYSYSDIIPFSKAKIKIKQEVLTFKENNLPPVTEKTGTFIAPEEWNSIISDPSVITIDTRNTYEVAAGSFQGAIDPKTETFIEFKDFVRNNLDSKKHKKVAMYCTGGIRCERASNFMLEEGFEEIYQLKGGITSYLREVKQEDSMWNGNCFIFDDRRELNHNLEKAQ